MATTGFVVEANAAGRWRSGGLLGWEIGARFGRWGVYLGAAVQPAVTWDFEGRTISVAAIPLALGYNGLTWRRGAFELRPDLALLLEQLRLRREDVANAAAHTQWEVGVSLGGQAIYRFRSGLGLGVGAFAAFFPATRTIAIPAGPSAQVSVATLKWMFFIDLRKDHGR